MFTPSELEQIPLEIQRLMINLSMDIMSDAIDRINMISSISRTADYELYTLSRIGLSSETIRRAIQDTLKLADAEVDRIYGEVIQEGYAKDESLYRAAGKSFTPYTQNAPLQQLVKAVRIQTKTEMANITRTTGFAIEMGGKTVYTPMAEYFQRTLDSAMMDITSGAFDYNSTVKKVIQEMTKSGVRTVDYESGWSNRIEVAARRAVMSGVTQVTGRITEMNMEALDTDYVEVSWHATARTGEGINNHQGWQGRVYHWNRRNNRQPDEEYPDFIENTGYGEILGLCGINCYHGFHSFLPGISERMYTDEQLEQMNAKENTPKEYRGKEYTSYEATQRQRHLETLMRKQRQDIKLLEQAGADPDDIINAQIRYRETMRQYREFSERMGLPQQRERIYADGLGKVGGDGKLASSRNRDIMKIKEDEFLQNLKSGNINTTIKWNKQREHLLGMKEWKKRVQDDIRLGKTPASSFLKGIDHNELISNNVGKGKIVFTNAKNLYPREYIQSNKVIGRVFNVGSGKYDYTRKMAIHYSKNGIHAHPVKEKE